MCLDTNNNFFYENRSCDRSAVTFYRPTYGGVYGHMEEALVSIESYMAKNANRCAKMWQIPFIEN